jgi:hypothetical protein
MLTYYTDHIEISIQLAQALLMVASSDETRPHLACLAIDHDDLCATDGHRAVQIALTTDGTNRHGCVWPRLYVETLIATARVAKRKHIELAFAACAADVTFPPISQVMPADGVAPESRAPIGVNPAYLGDLDKLRKACHAPGVLLSALRGQFDPIGFTIDGTRTGGLRARVAVMPMRI